MTELLTGVAILVGLVGIVVPVLPGSALVLGAIGVWAVLERTTSAWVVLAVAVALIVAAGVIKYVWPGQRMNRAGVPRSSLVVGAVVGIVGFFVVPVVGLPLGFVAGCYAAENARLRDRRRAWDATIQAVKAVGLSILVELAGALLAAGTWLGVLVLG